MLGNRKGKLGLILLAGTATSIFATEQVTTSDSAAQRQAAQVQAGRSFFERVWELPPAEGEGLGTLHNDVSCVACHFQAGAGGGGSIDKNVYLLSVDPRPRGMPRRPFREAMKAFHPSLEAHKQPVILLHKFSTSSAYETFRATFPGLKNLPSDSEDAQTGARADVARQPVREFVRAPQMHAQISQRNSTALFGAGAIDRLPRAVITAQALAQRREGVVSGNPGGRFGWKGQTASLAQFVRDACRGELGLRGLNESTERRKLTPPNADTNIVHSLTSFVSALPAPLAVVPTDPQRKLLARQGKALFTETGCSHCHVESLGSDTQTRIVGIYSDLLLHDMGPQLADPSLSGAGVTAERPRSSSYGGGLATFGPTLVTSWRERSDPQKRGTLHKKQIASQQEWRTPPLWGVAASAPYLHDGRAETLTEAILYHGGEARFAVQSFLRRTPEERLSMIAFLETLQPAEVAP